MSVTEALRRRDSEEIYLLPSPLAKELENMTDLWHCCARKKEEKISLVHVRQL